MRNLRAVDFCWSGQESNSLFPMIYLKSGKHANQENEAVEKLLTIRDEI